MPDDEIEPSSAAPITTREQRLRIVEAVMPGFWSVANPGTRTAGLLAEIDKFVAGGRNV